MEAEHSETHEQVAVGGSNESLEGIRRSVGSLSHAFHPNLRASRDVADAMESSTCIRRMIMKILMTPAFDYGMGVVILLNMVIMIIELDKQANEQESNRNAASWTEVCGWIVLLIFVVELAMRVFTFGRIFWRDAWNVCDFMIVAIDAFFSLIGLVVGDAFPISILRIFRLAKLARISKVIRVFPELRVLLACLVGSTRAIFWGIVLLFFVLLVWSMIAVLFIHPLTKDIDFGDCARCPRAYESVMRSALTFWQQIVAGDSWGQTTIPVIEKHPETVIFYIPLFMSVGMAVMNLILGVVVNVALSAKDQIEAEDSTERRLFKMEQHTHLLDLCQQMDVRRSGRLNRDEVFESFEKEGEFRDRILSMDVTDEDFQIVWSVVDADRKGSVRYTELLKRLYSIRSSDSEFMLAYIKYYITETRNDLLKEWNDLGERLNFLERKFDGKNHSGDELFVQEQEKLHTGGAAFGTWQVLNENQQRMYKRKPSKEIEANGKGTSSCMQLETSYRSVKGNEAAHVILHDTGSVAASRAPDRPNSWDKQLHQDIEALQIQFAKILNDMNEKIEVRIPPVLTMSRRTYL